ncbi:penicillin-binding protein 1B [Arsukibacterium sp. UBA3155]|uniref:penicillin-binding protein 1B n=1 Tax=Arsukibacterium sp. UBA3155 TaxID=1946058 RepID=UPI0025C36F59|nr:penicillin-binding protein 1B [Arsukibacterium sp. UBA3155]|tara:strand:+ start:93030 stop:95285 length:2256 start_codon:yes stop_codon:yes gene_type:complete
MSTRSKGAGTPKMKVRPWWHRSLITLGKLALVTLCVLLTYLIYLDSKVTRAFAGQKWQVPAQIYARSLELYPGKALSSLQLQAELEQLQYQRNPAMTAAGQYSVSRNHVTIYRRAFTYIDGMEPEALFSVEFNSSGINRIRYRQQQEVNFARLEPQLIEHMLSPHQEDRELVRLEQVPGLLKEGLLLVEDRDFYHHRGVSPLSVLRALWANISAGRTVQGGSTLTQQLAKNMYLTSDRTLLRKVNEAMIALILDYRFSKDHLLEAYLNEIFLGQNHATAVHGFGLASRFYFAKPITELRPDEMALMIGLLKGPSYYDPRRYPERAVNRRDLVLRLMFEHHLLTGEQYQQALAQPLQLVARGQYLNARFPAYLDAVKKELRQINFDQRLLSSGIKVFTFLDPKAQQQAELTVTEQLQNKDEQLQAAMMVVNYQQAEIQALVGGRESGFAGFNRALDARRQIGSIIKPVIYLEALNQPGRFSLASILQDQPLSLRSNNEDWQPQNFDKTFRGPVNLVTALTDSLNVPTVRLGLQLGMPAISDGLRKLGLNRRVSLHPAALLGAVELSPMEVSQLYQTIANDGVYQMLATVQAVTDQDGHRLYHRSGERYSRYPPSSIYLLQHALISATQTGTAKALQYAMPTTVFAGKTGTSSDYRDSWFSGFDQQTLVTIWLGRDDNKPIGLTGSSGALPLFIDFFKGQGAQSIIQYLPDQVQVQAFSASSGTPVAETCANILLLPAISDEMQQQLTCENSN